MRSISLFTIIFLKTSALYSMYLNPVKDQYFSDLVLLKSKKQRPHKKKKKKKTSNYKHLKKKKNRTVISSAIREGLAAVKVHETVSVSLLTVLRLSYTKHQYIYQQSIVMFSIRFILNILYTYVTLEYNSHLEKY